MNNFSYYVSRVWPSLNVQDIQAPNRSTEHAKGTVEKQSPGMPRFAVGPPYSLGFSWQCYQRLIVPPAFLYNICPNFVPFVLATTVFNLSLSHSIRPIFHFSLSQWIYPNSIFEYDPDIFTLYPLCLISQYLTTLTRCSVIPNFLVSVPKTK